MPTAKIDFGNHLRSGLAELGGASPIAMNVITDRTGAIHRRPGLMTVPGQIDSVIEPSGIHGVYQTVDGKLFAVARNQRVFRVLGATAAEMPYVVTAGGFSTPRAVTGRLRPYFAETELILVIVAGAEPWKVVLREGTMVELGGSPPNKVSHMVAMSSRLLANDLVTSPNTLRYSSPAGGTTSYAGLEEWTLGVGTAGTFSAESKPDPITAVHENSNELFLFGPASLQVFAPDPVLRFATASVKEIGLVAPDSVIEFDQSFAFLATPRRFVATDGRQDQVLSDDIQETLDGLSRVDDCFGYRVQSGPSDCLVWTFPTDARTFAYQVGVGWSEWLGWGTDNWAPLNVLSSFTGPDRIVYAGTSDGRLVQFSSRASTDLGAYINARVQTGYINRDTDARKLCRGVRIRVRRGTTTAGHPRGWLRWRDRPGLWNGQIPVDFGISGDSNPVIHLHSLGVYRARQWEFEFTGAEELILASVEEDFEVLPV